MWDLDHKEGWASKNWCFWSVVFEKTLESPLGCKEIKTVNPKGNQPWIFIGRTDAEAQALILCPPDAKSRKRPCCWERLKAGGGGRSRGRDGEVASPTQWTWIWANSVIQWRTQEPGILQSMGLQSWTWLSNWTTTGPLYLFAMKVRQQTRKGAICFRWQSFFIHITPRVKYWLKIHLIGLSQDDCSQLSSSCLRVLVSSWGSRSHPHRNSSLRFLPKQVTEFSYCSFISTQAPCDPDV